jgi:very-short-patch-repair endonuclease/peptidyl-tRNA hydrolase
MYLELKRKYDKSHMTKKHTFDYVYDCFKKQDCELLEKVYKNNKTKMKYICNCGNESEITFGHFKRGRRCMKCSGSEKHTFDYVYDCFKKQDCELLEKVYKNNNTKMEYRCNCGNESEITFGHFKTGRRCMKCSGKEKHTFDYVYECFKKQDCELLEKVYKNANTKMEYICNCGNDSEITFGNFKKGVRCSKCSGNEKHTFDYVYDYFKEQDCELLEKVYKNNNTKMKYRCNCGNDSEITFGNFKTGVRCNMCKNKTEKILYEWLKENYKNVIFQAKFEWCKDKYHLPFDFLLEDYNLLIELDGPQHFEQVSNWVSPEETQKKDVYKMNIALQNSYFIIRVCQHDVFNNTIDWKQLLKEAIEDITYNVHYISQNIEIYDNHNLLYPIIC